MDALVKFVGALPAIYADFFVDFPFFAVAGALFGVPAIALAFGAEKNWARVAGIALCVLGSLLVQAQFIYQAYKYWDFLFR